MFINLAVTAHNYVLQCELLFYKIQSLLMNVALYFFILTHSFIKFLIGIYICPQNYTSTMIKAMDLGQYLGHKNVKF